MQNLTSLSLNQKSSRGAWLEWSDSWRISRWTAWGSGWWGSALLGRSWGWRRRCSPPSSPPPPPSPLSSGAAAAAATRGSQSRRRRRRPSRSSGTSWAWPSWGSCGTWPTPSSSTSTLSACSTVKRYNMINKGQVEQSTGPLYKSYVKDMEQNPNQNTA